MPITTVRVFLSATFRDMLAEREYLHARVFPFLQDWYAHREVHLVFVDLEWEAAEDQAEGFDNLKRCLDEVEQCRPFFIGLLGSRYGKGVETIKADAARAYPWLRQCKKGTSRLHLEVLQGVLIHPQQAQHSFFYLRRPGFLKLAPADQSKRFLPDSATETARRAALEKALRTSGRPLREYDCQWDSAANRVTGLEELGKLIADDVEIAVGEFLHQPVSKPTLGDKLLADEDVLLLEDSGVDLGASLDVGEADTGVALARPGFDSQVGKAKQPQVDENVQFTVYRPRVVQPQKWYDLLAFAHLAEKPADAPAEEPDPVEEVQRQAKQILGEKVSEYQDLTQDSLQAVPKQGEITFVPYVKDIEFNPPRRTFTWQESVHREEFRLRADASLDGRTVRGKLSIFLGAILLGDVPLVIEVDKTHQPAKTREPLEPVPAHRYRKIFASYSHKDLGIVEQFEAYAATMGDEYLRDWKHLRAGEVWSEKLRLLIKQADVFQLFWSGNSMRSDFVRQEWEYALELAASHPDDYPDFIRPTYWEDPMPNSVNPQLPPAPLARLHFQRLGVVLAPAGTDEDAEADDSFEDAEEPQHGRPRAVMEDSEYGEEDADYSADMDYKEAPSRASAAGSRGALGGFLLFLVVLFGGIVAMLYWFPGKLQAVLNSIEELFHHR